MEPRVVSPCFFAVPLSVNGKTSKKSMAHREETARCAMLFFELLPFTDKTNMTLFWCVKASMCPRRVFWWGA